MLRLLVPTGLHIFSTTSLIRFFTVLLLSRTIGIPTAEALQSSTSHAVLGVTSKRRKADDFRKHARFATSSRHLYSGRTTRTSSQEMHSMRPSYGDQESPQAVHQPQHLQEERFSIAPMMGHTNRHYRYFVRLFSQHTHLYTEMIPASQIVRAYRRAKAIYGKQDEAHHQTYSHSLSKEQMYPSEEELLEIVSKIKQCPEKEYHFFGRERGNRQIQTLSELVGHASLSPSSSHNEEDYNENSVVLQLGGKDPDVLGSASCIGRAFGNYDSINLNCGCPSNAVGGRNGGAALMTNPTLVAQCVERMNESVLKLDEYSGATSTRTTAAENSVSTTRPKCTITVKHRLGVRDASAYDAVSDHQKDDTEAFETCKTFVKAITLGGAVSKCHLHARLGLLGEFSPTTTNDREAQGSDVNHNDSPSSSTKSSSQTLWVPEQSNNTNKLNNADNKDSNASDKPKRVKIDHKREQERARKLAREATIKNRYVPPLRQNVVQMLAKEFPQIDFVANGGIQTITDVQGIVNTNRSNAIGAMVGRAAINHPCSFASADTLWYSSDYGEPDRLQRIRPTRGEVLQKYIEYCDNEEDRLSSYGVSQETIDNLRQRLVGVPFHLFMGEEGNDAYQRRVKKLMSKTVRIKASSILSGAASFIPPETLNKCVDDHVPWKDIPIYEGAYRRSSAMQKVVY